MVCLILKRKGGKRERGKAEGRGVRCGTETETEGTRK